MAARPQKAPAEELHWLSAARHRVVLRVDPRRGGRSHSPAAVLLDPAKLLTDAGATGAWDEDATEVIAYDAVGEPAVFDAARPGHERHLLPWHIEKLYGVSAVTLRFVLPSERFTTVAVYLETREAGQGQQARYRGLVGDGDLFVGERGRRASGATHFDCLADLDRDGDLDLFQGGVEPTIRCLENVGGGRLEDRGLLTSGGRLLTLPHNRGNGRSWVLPHFFDLDGDGDLDFFPSFTDGPQSHRIVHFENVTAPGGSLTFAERGPLVTTSGTPVAGGTQEGGWFPSVVFARDFDGPGDGRIDLVVGSKDRCWLYRSRGRDAAGRWQGAEAEALRAAGEEIKLFNPCFDLADVDGDGDRDLLAAPQSGQILLFENTDASSERRSPAFAASRVIAHDDTYLQPSTHPRVVAADFTGDGLIDLVIDRAWELADLPRARDARTADRQDHGGFFVNSGTASSPRWERRDDAPGALHSVAFQPCDAVRQNVVRAFDWDGDGRLDLLAGDCDGFVWWFRSLTGRLAPVFAAPVRLRAGDGILDRSGSSGHARPDVCDWNGDQLPDLVVADGSGAVTAYLNVGSRTRPRLDAGRRLEAVDEGGAAKPLQVGSRAHLLAADWDADGKVDLLLSDQESRSFFVCRNTGEPGQPRLSPPRRLELDRVVRPNFGSLVDWDGDAKQDLIACEFEKSIRLFRNVGTGKSGEEPRFADGKGVALVEPATVMMVSGADVVDWNGDGDLDIVTGMGHGGSGIRWFERDWIEDESRDTHPVVAVERVESDALACLDVVRRYADAMLEHGRDTHGAVESGLFLSALDRRTLRPLTVRPAPPGGVRREDRAGLPWRPLTGSNPHVDQNLLRLLYALTPITGDARYAAAADHEVKWFLDNAQSPVTGLLAWGEHMAWDAVLDRPIAGGTELTHEFARPWALWERSLALAPEAVQRFALGLWRCQIANHKTGGFDRHAVYDRCAPADGKDFARHGAFYIQTWAHAYRHAPDPTLLEAIEAILARFVRKRAAAPAATLGPLELEDAAALVPEPLASRLRDFARGEDRLILADLQRAHGRPGGGWAFPATWEAGYSSGVTADWAMFALARHAQAPQPELEGIIVAVADAYLDAFPDEDVDLWPMSLSHVISAEVAAYRLTGRGAYLAGACRLARFAARAFWEDSPLPRASLKTGHYETITGGDSLALSLLEVHAARNGLKLELPQNTIDR